MESKKNSTNKPDAGTQKPSRSENDQKSLEQDIFEPMSKAASTSNQGHGYRGSLQRTESDQNEKGLSGNKRKHIQPNEDMYDTSDETKGGGMGGSIKGTRVDGAKSDPEQEPKRRD
jgi:hypothetical protein